VLVLGLSDPPRNGGPPLDAGTVEVALARLDEAVFMVSLVILTAVACASKFLPEDSAGFFDNLRHRHL